MRMLEKDIILKIVCAFGRRTRAMRKRNSEEN
jgi:hypothetical protein